MKQRNNEDGVAWLILWAGGLLMLTLSMMWAGAQAGWVCEECTYVDLPSADYVLLQSAGTITEHGDLAADTTYAHPLGLTSYWAKVTLTSRNLALANEQSHWAFAVSADPGSRTGHDGQARCAADGINEISAFLFLTDVTFPGTYYCAIPPGGPYYLNFWPAGPGAADCGTAKPCAVKIIDGSAQ